MKAKKNKTHSRLERDFYSPVCSLDEINRIFNVKNAHDYLLKLRADTLVDHMRLFRVYRNKKLLAGEDKWSLTDSFDISHYNSYLNYLQEDDKKKCMAIVVGDIFSNDPNGMIFNTKYGPIITISES